MKIIVFLLILLALLIINYIGSVCYTVYFLHNYSIDHPEFLCSYNKTKECTIIKFNLRKSHILELEFIFNMESLIGYYGNTKIFLNFYSCVKDLFDFLYTLYDSYSRDSVYSIYNKITVDCINDEWVYAREKNS